MEVKKLFWAMLLLTLLAVQIFGTELSTLPVHAQEQQEPKKKVALTFDDGPSEKYTKEILDLLDQYHVKATFFVIGSNVCRNPDLLRLEVARGHEIGNHTFTHPHLKKVDQVSLEDELQKTADAVYAISGKRLKLFRPPEGYRSEAVASATQNLGYQQVFWTIDTTDWAHNSTKNIVATIKKNVKDGSIILMHDYIVGESHTADALRQIIPYLQEQGYQFVTVPELG